MTSSSPEYLITKAGMRVKRDKPLRTYGKRYTTEPPTKRRRTADTDSARDERHTGRKEKEEGKENVAPGTKAAQSKRAEMGGEMLVKEREVLKGSIMSFFKPVPAKVPSPISDDISTEEPATKPARRAKSPRILRINQPAPPSSPPKSTTSPTRPHQEAAQRAPSTRTLKHPPKVQTTLNISSKAAFSECKTCDTVWNPLYPDDVKYHGRRHAAVLRARRKTAKMAE